MENRKKCKSEKYGDCYHKNVLLEESTLFIDISSSKGKDDLSHEATNYILKFMKRMNSLPLVFQADD